jgi:hypothetical protein
MAERGLGTGKINYSIHDTIAVVIQVGQKMSYLHDFHYAMFVVGKSPVRTMVKLPQRGWTLSEFLLFVWWISN